MRARTGLWEPWVVTPRATRSDRTNDIVVFAFGVSCPHFILAPFSPATRASRARPPRSMTASTTRLYGRGRKGASLE